MKNRYSSSSTHRKCVLIICALFAMMFDSALYAQLKGDHIPGAEGLQSGSQAPPGLYIADMVYFYTSDNLKGDAGRPLPFPRVNSFLDGVGFSWVLPHKVLGGNLGGMVMVPFVQNRIQGNFIGDSATGFSISDMALQPLSLGWHFKRVDVTTGYVIYMPAGSFTPGASDNHGFGMWGNEVNAGTTIFLDEKRRWHLAEFNAYELHSKKREIDQKVGQILTVEWGLGRTFMKPTGFQIPTIMNLGLIGYGQFKTTADTGADLPLPNVISQIRDRVLALGPEFNILWPKQRLNLMVRYFKEFGARNRTEGQGVFVSLAFIAKSYAHAPDQPLSAACSANPMEVMSGEPVTVTATPGHVDPKHSLTYAWNSTGGQVSRGGSTSTIDTAGLSGGNYTATARVSDPHAKKVAEVACSASFMVKELPKNPPTISCSASPSSLQAGSVTTLSCDCKSPDSDPVNVGGWATSKGTVVGDGRSVTLNTTGIPPGAIAVSATCTDARGLTTTASTQAMVEVPPPPPPAPQATKLSECNFPSKGKPGRIDNACKAVLDDAGLALKNQPGARLAVVGHADSAPKATRRNLAAERALNAKAYLSAGEAHQAIDPGTIDTLVAADGGQQVEIWLIPQGASFSQAGAQIVDQSSFKSPDRQRTVANKQGGCE
jgi:outer membrane protein OmpA-like peptidoglycan-associated protein